MYFYRPASNGFSGMFLSFSFAASCMHNASPPQPAKRETWTISIASLAEDGLSVAPSWVGSCPRVYRVPPRSYSSIGSTSIKSCLTFLSSIWNNQAAGIPRCNPCCWTGIHSSARMEIRKRRGLAPYLVRRALGARFRPCWQAGWYLREPLLHALLGHRGSFR